MARFFFILFLFVSKLRTALSALSPSSPILAKIKIRSEGIDKNQNDENRRRRTLTRPTLLRRVRNKITSLFVLQGGSVVEAGSESTAAAAESQESSPCAILVSTSIGSSFLDKKKRIMLPRNSTIRELKAVIGEKFPGSPPTALQRLFIGTRALSDDELVANITTVSPVPILLDMLTGTSAYNKTMSITQALEAYAAMTAHQAYIGEKMHSIFRAEASAAADSYGYGDEEEDMDDHERVSAVPKAAQVAEMDSPIYREIFHTVNESLYQMYAEDISEALIVEMEPEVSSADTSAWRASNRREKNPLIKALAKEFDLNLRGFKSFAYYSLLLGVFAYFGTTSQLSTQFLLCMVPFLWVSKLRQLRLIFKLALNLILPVIARVNFLMPLLPAPYQVIAKESLTWDNAADGSKGAPPGENSQSKHKKRKPSTFGSSDSSAIRADEKQGKKEVDEDSRIDSPSEEADENEGENEDDDEDQDEDLGDSDEAGSDSEIEQEEELAVEEEVETGDDEDNQDEKEESEEIADEENVDDDDEKNEDGNSGIDEDVEIIEDLEDEE